MRGSGNVASAISAYGGVIRMSASANNAERAAFIARMQSSWRELPGERGEVRVHLGAGRELPLVVGLAALPGEHQYRPRARRRRRFHVALRVAHHVDV